VAQPRSRLTLLAPHQAIRSPSHQLHRRTGQALLLISSRATSTLFKLDRNTGEIAWRLDGKRSDFEMGPGARFTFQHGPRRHPDGTITISDDGRLGTVE
jgi:hypothetical protein